MAGLKGDPEGFVQVQVIVEILDAVQVGQALKFFVFDLGVVHEQGDCLRGFLGGFGETFV